MAFVLRATEIPSLARLTEVSQIVIVDKTGPAIPIGGRAGVACLVGEFLKGPFTTREVTSLGDILSAYGAFSALLSQSISGATIVQDGGGQRFEGNGMLQLIGRQFLRLALQRVDTRMTTTDGGATNAYAKFTVKVGADDLDGTDTNKDIVIPAGTRFADAALTSATGVIALAQDVLIPKGTATTLSAGDRVVVVAANTLTSNADGAHTYDPDSTDPKTGASAFFVKGAALGSGLLTTPIDVSLPNVSSDTVIRASGGDTAGVTNAGGATAIFAAGTAALTLSKKIDSLYAAAIDKTRPSTGTAASDITVIWAARRGKTATTVRTPLVQNAIDSSSEGRGRVAVVSGPRVGDATDVTDGYGDASTVSAAKTEVDDVTTAESPGRVDRKFVTFPYNDVFESDLGQLVTISPDGFLASTLSNFPEEKNPGARNDFIQAIQQLQEAFRLSPLTRTDYVNFKASGVAALRKDRSVGWWFQDGVTSVDPVEEQTRAPIKRRRMADFIQDTLAAIGAKYSKEPATTERVDQLLGEMEAFLSGLKSPPNPAQQRIEDYSIDGTSGNTPSLTALGIFTFLVKVRLLASMDTIVFATTIGETVTVTQTT